MRPLLRVRRGDLVRTNHSALRDCDVPSVDRHERLLAVELRGVALRDDSLSLAGKEGHVVVGVRRRKDALSALHAAELEMRHERDGLGRVSELDGDERLPLADRALRLRLKRHLRERIEVLEVVVADDLVVVAQLVRLRGIARAVVPVEVVRDELSSCVE